MNTNVSIMFMKLVITIGLPGNLKDKSTANYTNVYY